MKRIKGNTIKRTISNILIVSQFYFYTGCYISQPLQKYDTMENNVRVTKYVMIDGEEIDCTNDLEGFALIQNDHIVRELADYSRQEIPLNQVKKVYSESFTWTGTVIAITFVIAIPVGIYALAIRHALNDPRR